MESTVKTRMNYECTLKMNLGWPFSDTDVFRVPPFSSHPASVKKGHGRFARGDGHCHKIGSICWVPFFTRQMAQFSDAAGQSAADFAQTFRLRQLVKQHGYEMIPAAAALAESFGFMAQDQAMKLTAIEYCNQLTKQACMSYSQAGLPVVGSRFFVAVKPCLTRRFFSRPDWITSS